jgi:hypothetical protein
MKTRMLGIFAVSALLGAALATTSVAQDRQRGFDGPRGEARGPAGQIRGRLRGGPRGRGAGAQPERFIERHDTDADGQVSESEFVDERLTRIDQLFERRDTDGDGLISAEEHDAPRGLRGRPGRAPRGERVRAERPEIDRDAVAACVRETIADLEPRSNGERDEVFANVDSNGDDMLSLQEVSAAIEARAQDLFARIDGDGNGYVTEDEASAHFEAQLDLRRAATACVREQLAD